MTTWRIPTRQRPTGPACTPVVVLTRPVRHVRTEQVTTIERPRSRVVGAWSSVPSERAPCFDVSGFAAPRSAETAVTARLSQLGGRERDVLVAVAPGSRNAEISRDLCNRPATVTSHVSSVLSRHGLRDRARRAVFV